MIGAAGRPEDVEEMKRSSNAFIQKVQEQQNTMELPQMNDLVREQLERVDAHALCLGLPLERLRETNPWNK